MIHWLILAQGKSNIRRPYEHAPHMGSNPSDVPSMMGKLTPARTWRQASRCLSRCGVHPSTLLNTSLRQTMQPVPAPPKRRPTRRGLPRQATRASGALWRALQRWRSWSQRRSIVGTCPYYGAADLSIPREAAGTGRAAEPCVMAIWPYGCLSWGRGCSHSGSSSQLCISMAAAAAPTDAALAAYQQMVDAAIARGTTGPRV